MLHCDLIVHSRGMAHQPQIKAFVLYNLTNMYVYRHMYLPRVRFLHMATGAICEEKTSSSCFCEDKTGERIDLPK